MSENNSTVVLSADDATAKPLIAHIKSSVNSAAKYSAYVTAHGVTRDNVKHHAAALAVLAYPGDAPVQRKDGQRTRFGNAVQAAGAGLRKALGSKEPVATDYLLRVQKAVEAAVDHDIDAEMIREAIAGLLGE
jgi:uncharacterized protein YecA (UPF0149 family)